MSEVSTARETWIPSVLNPAGSVPTMTGKWKQFSRQPADFGFDDDVRDAGMGGTAGVL